LPTSGSSSASSTRSARRRRGRAPSALDAESLLPQEFPDPVAQIALEFDGAIPDGAAGAARALQLLAQLLEKGGIARQSYTTLTVFPPRPAFSTRSFATTRTGTGSSVARELHRQALAGQPQPGHILPVAVE
jgi:hypothetical protein